MTHPASHPARPLNLSAPLHGYRPPAETPEEFCYPLELTVAISRETGSRGILVAQRLAQLLGWQLYQQESLEYLAQDPGVARELFDCLDHPGLAWVDAQINEWSRQVPSSMVGSMRDLARVIFAIGARGRAVILGRGAGFLLPCPSTLHVRVIAPLAERIAFLAQLERLTPEQSAEQVTARDERRSQFLASTLQRRPEDLYQYDVVINTALLRVPLAAQMLAHAAKLKNQAWQERREAGQTQDAGLAVS
jgi:hypothetical protein